MQRLEVSGAVRPIYGSLGVKRLISIIIIIIIIFSHEVISLNLSHVILKILKVAIPMSVGLLSIFRKPCCSFLVMSCWLIFPKITSATAAHFSKLHIDALFKDLKVSVPG